MKLSMLAAVLLFSLTATAYEEGHYICGANSEYTYNIKKLDVGGTVLPFVEVTTTTRDHKTQSIKGIANLINTAEGEEILALGSITMELKGGRPKCAKP